MRRPRPPRGCQAIGKKKPVSTKLVFLKAVINDMLVPLTTLWHTAFKIAVPAKQSFVKLVTFPSIRDLHMALIIPYLYHFITKLCRQHAQVIKNHANKNIR
jgi:hypothetical protein